MGGRHNRRLPVASLPKIDVQPVHATWRVTLTNGSGVTTVELDGTSGVCWEVSPLYVSKPGRWLPTSIEKIKDVSGPFNIVG